MQLGMVATIYKRFLLDTEFYGQLADVEIISLAADEPKGERLVRRYSLDSLELWDDQRLADRLTLISEALDLASRSGLVKLRRLTRPAIAPDMPLFD